MKRIKMYTESRITKKNIIQKGKMMQTIQEIEKVLRKMKPELIDWCQEKPELKEHLRQQKKKQNYQTQRATFVMEKKAEKPNTLKMNRQQRRAREKELRRRKKRQKKQLKHLTPLQYLQKKKLRK